TAKVGAEHGEPDEEPTEDRPEGEGHEDGLEKGGDVFPPEHHDGAMKYAGERMAHHASCKNCKSCYEKSQQPEQNAAAPPMSAGPTNASMPGKAMPEQHAKKGVPSKNGAADRSLADEVISENKPARNAREKANDDRITRIEQRYARSEADKLVTQLADVEGYL